MKYYYHTNVIYESSPIGNKIVLGSQDCDYYDNTSELKQLSELFALIIEDFKSLCKNIQSARTAENGTWLYLQGTSHHLKYSKNQTFFLTCTPMHITLNINSTVIFTNPLNEYNGLKKDMINTYFLLKLIGR